MPLSMHMARRERKDEQGESGVVLYTCRSHLVFQYVEWRDEYRSLNTEYFSVEIGNSVSFCIVFKRTSCA